MKCARVLIKELTLKSGSLKKKKRTQFALMFVFLYSVKLQKCREIASMLEHGIKNNLILCSWAMVTQNGSRGDCLSFPLR